LSRIDFAHGFGFDIPEEEEEEEEAGQVFGVHREPGFDPMAGEIAQQDSSDDVDDESRTAAPTRIHSRHVSKSQQEAWAESGNSHKRVESIPLSKVDVALASWPEAEPSPDAASEWTGSEDGKGVEEPTDDDDDKVCHLPLYSFFSRITLFCRAWESFQIRLMRNELTKSACIFV
jgi:hypothetical protein